MKTMYLLLGKSNVEKYLASIEQNIVSCNLHDEISIFDFETQKAYDEFMETVIRVIQKDAWLLLFSHEALVCSKQ